MASNENLFSKELSGYKKKQVDDYISKMIIENAKLKGSCATELEELKTKLSAAEEENETIKSNLSALEEELNNCKAELASLQDECEKMRNEKDLVAKILVDTQKRADDIIEQTTKDAKEEKARLEGECNLFKDEINARTDAMRLIADNSKKSVEDLIALIKKYTEEMQADILSRVDNEGVDIEAFVAEHKTEPETPKNEVTVEEPVPVMAETETKSETEEKTKPAIVPVVPKGMKKPENSNAIPEDFTFAATDDAKEYFTEG